MDLYFGSSSCLVKSLTIKGIDMLILLEYLSHSVVCIPYLLLHSVWKPIATKQESRQKKIKSS